MRIEGPTLVKTSNFVIVTSAGFLLLLFQFFFFLVCVNVFFGVVYQAAVEVALIGAVTEGVEVDCATFDAGIVDSSCMF